VRKPLKKIKSKQIPSRKRKVEAEIHNTRSKKVKVNEKDEGSKVSGICLRSGKNTTQKGISH